MKPLIAVVVLLGALALGPGSSVAQERRPARTLVFQLYLFQVEGCAGLGAEWPRRVSASLALAKKNTEGFLPAELWDALIRASSDGKERQGRYIPPAADCERLVENLSDPRFRSELRGSVAIAVLSAPVYKCMLEFPSLAGEMREAWTAAFARNGFRLTEDEVTRGLEEWRRRGVAPRPAGDSEEATCKRAMQSLREDFDVTFSEERIADFLLTDLDKK